MATASAMAITHLRALPLSPRRAITLLPAMDIIQPAPQHSTVGGRPLRYFLLPSFFFCLAAAFFASLAAFSAAALSSASAFFR
jgi:hypothetical protein